MCSVIWFTETNMVKSIRAEAEYIWIRNKPELANFKVISKRKIGTQSECR